MPVNGVSFGSSAASALGLPEVAGMLFSDAFSVSLLRNLNAACLSGMSGRMAGEM